MDNVERTKRYFDKNVDRLKRLKQHKQSVIVRETALALKSELKGKVLDIGSGGRVYYSLDKVDKLVSLDISSESLKIREGKQKIEFTQGDARNLPMKNDTFDSVLMSYIIHHLAANKVADTYKHVEGCLREIYRILNNSGKILIADPICPKIIQKIENIFFNFSRATLNLLSKPMVYFFSLQDLISILDKVGFKKISFFKLNTDNARLSPFTFSISTPFKYTPLSHFIIKGVKE